MMPLSWISVIWRLSKIAKGSLKDADMQIKIEKTKGMGELQTARSDYGHHGQGSADRTRLVCKFKCLHNMCNFVNMSVGEI